MPGGCAIGGRPIDLHLRGLERLGAEITLTQGYVEARATRLKGARIVFDLVTVTGTENLMMPPPWRGDVVLENAARARSRLRSSWAMGRIARDRRIEIEACRPGGARIGSSRPGGAGLPGGRGHHPGMSPSGRGARPRRRLDKLEATGA
jgi:hypothetical protein